MGRPILPGGPPASLTQQRADLVVFACGDPAHGEHPSIAIAACEGLPPDVLERIDLKITGAMRPEYLSGLRPSTRVIIADTVPGTPSTPGTESEIEELTFLELVGREEPLMTSSTPEPALDEVIAMAELLRDEPLTGRFIGLAVESEDLRAAPDSAAVERLRQAIVEAIARLAH